MLIGNGPIQARSHQKRSEKCVEQLILEAIRAAPPLPLAHKSTSFAVLCTSPPLGLSFHFKSTQRGPDTRGLLGNCLTKETKCFSSMLDCTSHRHLLGLHSQHLLGWPLEGPRARLLRRGLGRAARRRGLRASSCADQRPSRKRAAEPRPLRAAKLASCLRRPKA